MSDLIDRQKAVGICDWYEHEFVECEYAIRHIADELKNLRSVELRPKTGKWLFLDDQLLGELYHSYKCTVCGKEVEVDSARRCDIGFVIEDLRYCPNCGARMEE